jgi:acetyl esterase/lipase
MSFKGKLVHYALKNRHIIKGRLKPDVIDKNTSIERLRYENDMMAEKLVKKIDGIKYEKTNFPDFYSEWVKFDGAPEEKIVLYFHGGGFVMGNAKSHRNLVGNFVKNLGVNALVFDYSLAPEYPAPRAVKDSFKIYKWLLDNGYKSSNIAFAGDSAGGGIALATMLMCKDLNEVLPRVCGVFSPCTDMTMSGKSHKTRKKYDPCTPEGANETYLGYYTGNNNPKNPYASPLFGDLTGLPPIIIQVGNNETLRDDSVMFANKAKKSGVEVKINVWDGMFHCFPLMAPMFEEATKAMNETCKFLNERL